MIKSIVFDWDGMLHNTEERFSEMISKKYKIPIESILEFFTIDYPGCRIGKRDTRETLAKYLKEWNWKLTVDDFLNIWFEYGDIDNELLMSVKKLRMTSIQCILCTNNEKYRTNHIIKKYNLNEIFDFILSSGVVGLEKPNIDMFDKIIEITGRNKNEILFCDDDDENIKAARRYGLSVHKYTRISEFKNYLKEPGL